MKELIMDMLKKIRIVIVFYLFASVILFNTAFADPLTDIARLNLVTGSVSLLPAGEDQWVDASLNRPLVVGDSLWTDTSAKAALEFSSKTAIWLNSSTSLKIVNLTEDLGQFQLAEGSLVLIANEIKSGKTYEVDTPNIALIINKPGYYRVDVTNDENTSSTVVSIKIGLAEVYGQNTPAPQQIKEGTTCRYTGIDLQNPECTQLKSLDEFDNLVLQQEKHRLEAKNSSNYVSPSVLGYQDLESSGSWQIDDNYGNIWIPENVGSDWAPYRDGQWIWLNQWGWTWVDNQPWGFAPFHYGRWAFIDDRWAWVPGPVDVEALYAPALVVFIETGNDNISWFPLGPGEIYTPAYAVSGAYFNQLNVSNTYFHNIDVNNWYQKNNAQFDYKNKHIENAITSVNKNAFINAQPVNKAAIKLTQPELLKAPSLTHAPIAPINQSILGGTLTKGVKPPEKVITQHTIIKNQPSTPPASFTKVKGELTNNPGIPLNNQKSVTPIPTTRNLQPLNTPVKENQQIQGPAQHPTPMPVPQQEKLKPLKQQEIPAHPVIKHENIQKAPAQPVIRHENIQKAPAQPVIRHENIQKAPAQPVIRHENIQKAPAQPVIRHENIQKAPAQPVIRHENIQH
ncbi:hypothetical protein J2N86_05980 [Legionella lytica]|uniref:FecR protein domain-containing protein n=1 Tax=Legionella lytica TaxID=96232 RepID=A0ABY4YB18_9GAMM|nr:DUF6600 domain-containing protein [Legionella lytica]USQ14848.1 hypothetical protein J2N86_05980 [Legionella lytica]